MHSVINGVVPITAAWLRAEGDEMVVSLEINGKWYDVIREYCPDAPPISHIVEDGSIAKAVETRL